MRKFLIFLTLIISFQSWVKADDIRDFQIEGITVRDSLLEYFSLEEIKKFNSYFYKNKEYKILQTNIISDNYDSIEVTVKNGDNSYKIYQVLGGIFYKNNIKNCHNKQIEIDTEFTDLFTNNVKKTSWEKKHSADKTGNSFSKAIQYEFNSNDVVRISCYDWSKKFEDEVGYTDNLRVTIIDSYFRNWLNTVAHK